MAPQKATPPPAAIPPLELADGLKAADVNPTEVVSKWLSALQEQLDSREFNLPSLFIEESWWRDLVALTWDTRTLHGPGPISKYLAASDHGLTNLEVITKGGLQPALLNNGGMVWIQSGYSFRTKHGSGRGIIHLVNVSKDEWKAWMVMSQMEKLNTEDTLDGNAQRNSNAHASVPIDLSNGTTNGVTEGTIDSPDYQVIIIGAGQAGLALAAHLHHRGLKYLVIDKCSRVGDSWRARYKSITSHTPSYTDHSPFLPFPTDYPKYRDQEHVTTWLESYAQTMHLHLRLNTEVTHVSRFDLATRTYTLSLSPISSSTSATTTNGSSPNPTTLTTTHLVLAAGMFGLRPIIPTFPSPQSHFRGTIYHAKHHVSASSSSIPDLAHKRVVVIGAGTSAHDIAEDFAVAGARSVTMVQRGAIFSVSRESCEKVVLGMWDTGTSGLATEEADLVGNSFPFSVVRSFGVGQTVGMSEIDKEGLEGLVARGMKVKRGETGEGLVDHQFIKGGCFYIDQGCWREILEGRVKVLQSDGGVADVRGEEVVLSDGRTVGADVVVLATGYERCWTTVRDLLSQEALDKVGEVSELDGEGERIGWWRPTGLKGFWYMTGSFIWCRQFSALLALQIDAVEKGLNEGYWEE